MRQIFPRTTLPRCYASADQRWTAMAANFFSAASSNPLRLRSLSSTSRQTRFPILPQGLDSKKKKKEKNGRNFSSTILSSCWALTGNVAGRRLGRAPLRRCGFGRWSDPPACRLAHSIAEIMLHQLERHLLVSASVRRVHERVFTRRRKLIHVPAQALPRTGFACAKLRDL